MWASRALLIAVQNSRRGIEMKKRWMVFYCWLRSIRVSADEKIVQRVLRHAKSHVTKDRYIKAFDPAVMAAMKKLEATVDLVNQSAPRVHQIQ